MKSLNDSPFVREMERIQRELLAATTEEDRDAVNADRAHLLRMWAAGRLEEYLASRKGNE